MNRNHLKSILVFIVLVAIVSSCEKKVSPWQDPHPPGTPAPELTQIEPDTAYGGEAVTITGSGFSEDQGKNFIVFGKTVLFPETATESTLEFHLPVTGGEDYTTVPVKVTIAPGSEYWSNELEFTYKPVLEVLVTDAPFPLLGVGVDDEGNIYYSVAHEKVMKLTPDTTTVFAEGEYFVGDIKIGPNNQLYAACCGKIVVYSLDGTKVDEIILPQPPKDFDWDENGNLYYLKQWASVYKYNEDGTSTEIENLGCPMELKVFGDYLYVTNGDNNEIVKYEITAEGVNRVEAIPTGGVKPRGIDFDIEGTMYYTGWDDSNIHYIKEDGTAGTMYSGKVPIHVRHINLQGKCLYVDDCGGNITKFYIGKEASGY